MKSHKHPSASYHRWNEMPLEALRGTITRRFLTTENIMVAQVYFKKGDVVPRHVHTNEQITYIISGALEFWLGEDDSQHLVVGAGEVIVIPSSLPHRAIALEDTLDIDVFNPPRKDWIDGTDAYIRD